MPRSPLYQIRVPPAARHLFGGADRLRQRFELPEFAAKWLADTRAAIAEAVAAARVGREAQLAKIDLSQEVRFREAAHAWIEERQIEPSTRRMYRQHCDPHLIPTLGDLPLSAIGRTKLAAHLAARTRAGASARQLRLDVILVQGIVRYASERGWRVDASALLVRAPKAPAQSVRRWDPQRLAKAIAQIEPRDRVVCEVALATGMRAAELRAMECSWIDWRGRRIVIPPTATKRKRDRALPLHARLRSVLRAWLGRRTDGPVFPPLRSRGNGPARGRYMRGIAGKLKRLAGAAVTTGLHDLRHAYLSDLAHRGLSVVEIRDLAGHSSIVVTERYMHAAPGPIDRARRLLDTRVDTRRRRARA